MFSLLKLTNVVFQGYTHHETSAAFRVFSCTITSSTSLIPSLLLGTEIGAMDEIFIRINLVHNKGHWLCYHRHK